MKRRRIPHPLHSGLLCLAALFAIATTATPPAQAVRPAAGGGGGGGGPLPPPRVTMISDSVGAALLWHPEARVYLAEGFDFRLEALACRRLVVTGCFAPGGNPPSALETIRTLGTDLGPVVVIDVGYNDPPDEYAAGFDTVMQALTDAHVDRVIWVTLNEHEDVWVTNNAVTRDGPKRWPRLVIADWAPLAADNPDWFNDLVHLNAEGAAGFAHFLRPMILAALPKSDNGSTFSGHYRSS